MATKFYLAEIPDDFPATNVKFENMTKPLLAIPAKMVDGKPITIVGYINAGQKKYKANDYGFVEFNDNGADFAQFKDANMDTRYSVREKVSGDILGYLPLETGELVGIVRYFCDSLSPDSGLFHGLYLREQQDGSYHCRKPFQRFEQL